MFAIGIEETLAILALGQIDVCGLFDRVDHAVLGAAHAAQLGLEHVAIDIENPA